MKKIISLNILIFFAFESISQCVITGKLRGYEGENFVVIRQPINGYFSNLSYQKSDTVSILDNKFQVTITCREAVFVFLSFSDHTMKLIATPKDSIFFEIDFSGFSSKERIKCNFSGANADGHSYFYEYDYNPIVKYENIWLSLKSADENDIITEIKNELQRQTKPVEVLYMTAAIDSSYYSLLKHTIKTLLLNEATRKLGDFSLSNLKIKTKQARISIVNQLFDLYAPNNRNVYYGLFSNMYANTYFAFQRSVRLNTKGLYTQPDSIIKFSGKDYIIEGGNAFLFEVKDEKLKEFLIGSMILGCLSVGAQEALKDEIPLFTAYYPQSSYNTIINSYRTAKEKEREQSNANYEKYFPKLTPVIIDTIDSIKDFEFSKTGLFKNKLLYIDVWATWCGPCIREMEYNFKIDSFLYSKKINRLYISIDNPSQKQVWGKMVSKMHLGGYHILAGSKLNKFLSKLIGLSEGIIAIPRYLIIKNGKVLVSDAIRPSDFEGLKKQLEEMLSK